MRAHLLVSAVLLTAGSLDAHERWVKHALKSEYDRSLFEQLGWINLGTLLVFAALFLWGTRVSAGLRSHPWQQKINFSALIDWVPTVLRVTLGLGLLSMAVKGMYVAPDLVLAPGEGGFLAVLEGVLGVLLILGLLTRAASWTSLVLFAWIIVRRPFLAFEGEPITVINVLNYFEIVGIAIYLGLVGAGALAVDRWIDKRAPLPGPQRAQAVGIMRIALGLTLVLLGIQKFVHPDLPMGVLQNYADQIYEPIHAITGMSPELYVFAASAVETAVGVLVLAGIFVRPLMLVLAGLFTTTLIIFQEGVFAHLPLFGVVFAFFIEGAGSYRLDSLALPARVHPRLAGLLVALMICLPACGSPAGSTGSLSASPTGELTVLGERGIFEFDLEVTPARPTLGELFSVLVTARHIDTGQVVEGGSLHLDATMPEHRHGMTTAPRSHALPDGSHRAVGCRFHMYGKWQYEVAMVANGVTDRAVVEYEYAPETWEH